MATQTKLVDFKSQDIPLLQRWLTRHHVEPWFANTQEFLDWAARRPINAGQHIILHDSKPVGYLRWQLVDRQALDSVGLFDVPHNSADVDILIGEPAATGSAVGPAALLFLARKLKSIGGVPMIGLTSSVDNKLAHKAFEKAGFKLTTQYSVPEFGECYLFTLAL